MWNVSLKIPDMGYENKLEYIFTEIYARSD